jgi:hypothetical protein
MAKSGLLGPYRLSFDTLRGLITRVSPGVFALGHTNLDGRFLINKVGRADDDVCARLSNLIGTANLFKFGYFDSSEEAFKKECALYHDFSPPGNMVHPYRPIGTDWECPYCRTAEDLR